MTGSEYAPRVARVAVDVPLPHLDRVFDYAIPEKFAGSVRPGVRCRVRFAGRVRDGFVLEVADSTDVAGPLAPLERVPSGEVVLTPAVARLLRAVADHWCGTFGDVARLAVPPRHAATEAAVPPDYPAPTVEADVRVLGAYPQAEAYLAALRSGRPLRAVWTPAAVAADLGDGLGGVLDAVAAALASGRGALVLVPDAEVLTRLEARCAARFGAGSFATLSADAGPGARYRHFLAAARGHVRLVIGTRAAAYAPVRDLGLVAVWDEGNDLYADPVRPTRTPATWPPCALPPSRAPCCWQAPDAPPRPRLWSLAAGPDPWLWIPPSPGDTPRWSGWPATTTRPSPAIRTPARHACPGRCSRRSGWGWRPDRYSSRCPAPATSPRSPAAAAANPPAVRAAAGRSAARRAPRGFGWRVPPAASCRSRGTARTAARPGCAPPVWGWAVPPRSSARRSGR